MGEVELTVTVTEPSTRREVDVAVRAAADAEPREIVDAVAWCAAAALGVASPAAGRGGSGDAATRAEEPVAVAGDRASGEADRARRPGGDVDDGPASWLRAGAVLALRALGGGQWTLRPVRRRGPDQLGVGPGSASRSDSAATAGAVLLVTCGPEAGLVRRLPSGGRLVVGRSETADVVLTDPRVSRRHAEVALGADGGVMVTDLGSANGTVIDGAAIRCAAVALGESVGVGRSLLTVANPQVPAAVTDAGPHGLVVHRPPQLPAPTQRPVVTFPTAPPPPRHARFPVAAVMLPAVAGVVMCAVLRSWQYLAFALLSPLVGVGSVLGDRRSVRIERREALAAYRRETAAAAAQLESLVRRDELRRREATPDPATSLMIATGPSTRLWERRRAADDFLRLRIGVADLPADVEVRGAHGTPDHPPPIARRVPVIARLPDIGVLGVSGVPGDVGSLSRWLAAQVAVLHSPDDVGLVYLGSPSRGTEWGFVRWLPHARPRSGERCRVLAGTDASTIDDRIAELVAVIRRRAASAGARAGDPATDVLGLDRAVVVVVDGAAELRDRPGLGEVLRRGPAVGVYTICCDDDRRRLPPECGATVDLAPGGAATSGSLAIAGADLVADIAPDLVRAGWLDAVSRALAPLLTAGAGGPPTSLGHRPDAGAQPPRQVRLGDCPDLPRPIAGEVRRRWGQRTRPVATLGIGPTGPVTLDLCRDGPHALVAGTTGSGKSELLQTMIASLAATHGPDEVTFLLVDYKGGAAFRECARLPHVVGMVTDLDGQLTRRALASLSAELRRRERVLAAAGVADLDSLRADATAPAAARLVIVVDEFATLVEELPEFVRGLVGIAARGRSLGLHLVLATQRPGGAVSADIRANASARICLRVTGPAESIDVLDLPDAASLPEDRPGSGYLRVGSAPLVAFQAAWATAPQRLEGRDRVRCQAVTWQTVGMPDAADEPPPADDERATTTELSELVDAVSDAAADASPPAPPWLAPLPSILPFASVVGGTDACGVGPPVDELRPDGRPATGDTLVYGLVDVPSRQARELLRYDLRDDGHLLVTGAARSGRTTTLLTLGGAIARRPVGDTHLYVLDGEGGLAGLTALPHCGAYVGRNDPERAHRLVARLLHEIDERQRLLTHAAVADAREQRGLGRGNPLPWLVVMVDSWDTVAGADQTGALESIGDGLTRLLRDGFAVGLRVLATGGRSACFGPLSSLVTARLVLRQADPGDYALLGVGVGGVPRSMPPGRALVIRDGALVEVQVALPPDPLLPPVGETGRILGDGDGDGVAVRDGAGHVTSRPQTLLDDAPRVRQRMPDLDRVDAGMGRPATLAEQRRPFRVEPVPRHVTEAALQAALGRLPSAVDQPLWCGIGLGGDESGPVVVDLARDGPALLIAGRARSGRTSALVVMARQLASRGVGLVVVAPRPGPLRELAVAGTAGSGATVVPPVVAAGDHDVDRVRSVVDRAAGPLAVLVDDLDLISGSTLDGALCDVLRAGRDRPVAVIGAGPTDDLLTSFRGLAVELRRSRCVLLLGEARPGDGDLIDARVPRTARNGPGRGWLAVHGTLTPVQVAEPGVIAGVDLTR